MTNKEVLKTIEALNNIFKSDYLKEHESPSFVFSYRGRGKQISGEQYFDYFKLFNKLYSLYGLSKKKISFNAFHNETRDYFFEDCFNDESLRKWISSQTIRKFNCFVNIYGVVLNEKESLSIGKCVLLSNEDAIKEAGKVKRKTKGSSFLIDRFIRENSNDRTIVYLSVEACDKDYAAEEMEMELDKLVLLLRFIYGMKDKIYRIGKTKRVEQNDGYIISEDDAINIKTSVAGNTYSLPLGESFLHSKENQQFIKLFSKVDPNNLELAIMKSIEWIGMSIDEQYDDIAITEIVNGFEVLLKYDDGSMVTKSIQGQIAENVAFLIGNNLDERLKLKALFKEMYGFRSSVAHGSRKEDTGVYFEYASILKSSIISILENYNYCTSVQMLNEELEKYKFR